MVAGELIVAGILVASTVASLVGTWWATEESKKTSDKALAEQKAAQKQAAQLTIIGLVVSGISVAIIAFVYLSR